VAVEQFTYTGDPGSSTKDEVRFLVGDTIESRALFDDREILWQIGETPNTRIAGAELLLAKANEFARQADVRVGDVSKAFSKVAENMKKCSDKLRHQALKRAKPFFGGLTKSGKRDLNSQVDDVQPAFSIGQTDDPTIAQLNNDVSDLLGLVGL
jgi:hypothetical protein